MQYRAVATHNCAYLMSQSLIITIAHAQEAWQLKLTMAIHVRHVYCTQRVAGWLTQSRADERSFRLFRPGSP